MDLHVVNPDPRRHRIDIVRDKDDGARKSERSVGIFPDNGECTVTEVGRHEMNVSRSWRLNIYSTA
jgi:hypothetical protein